MVAVTMSHLQIAITIALLLFLITLIAMMFRYDEVRDKPPGSVNKRRAWRFMFIVGVTIIGIAGALWWPLGVYPLAFLAIPAGFLISMEFSGWR